MPPRQPNLNARLEDLRSELEALRLFRRQRLITDARAFKKQKDKLLRQIQSVEEDILIQRRSLELQRKEQRKTYIRTLDRRFRGTEPFTIEFGKDYITETQIFDRIVRQPGRWVLNVNGFHYTLNDKTRTRLRDLIEDDNTIVITEQISKSDEELVLAVRQFNQMRVEPVGDFNTYALDNAAFFKYTHTTHYDFSRYGIFTSIDAKNYDDNCLMYALKLAGVDAVIIEDLKLRMKNRNIPRSDLKKIAEDYNLTIIVRTANQEKAKIKPFVYGKGENPIYIGSLDNHYFLIEKTNYTRFCLENYEEVKNEMNSNTIIKRKGKYFERDATRCIDSYDLVKTLLANKNKLLKEITMNDQLIATTQFYDKVNTEITTLEYDEIKCCRPVAMPGSSKTQEYKTIFFDFETYTKDYVHIPYLCCTYDGITKQTFYGEYCAYEMLMSLTSNTRLIAHNANYDYRFLIKHLQQVQELSRGNRLIGCSAMFNGFHLEIKDSFHLISMALKKFPKTFGIPNIEKEVMPYDLYSEDTIKQRFVNANYVAETFISKNDQPKFFENIQKWQLMNMYGEYDIEEYSRRYCEIDCEILSQGYTTFRKWILDLTQIDIDGILTSASLAHRYLISQGCYEGVNELSGVPQTFIQGAVVGGRTMVSENKKIKIEGKINDFDAVSLYPSAMFRMDGFLKGKPKVLTNLSYDFLQKQDGYFVDIRILSVGIPRKFPLMSYKNDGGVRMFSNDMIGKVIRVDRYTLEDLIQFQGITFEVLRGYYFNEGFNNKINSVIKFLFDTRVKMKNEINIYSDKECKNLIETIEYTTKKKKKEDVERLTKENKYFVVGNPCQEVYKLIMNSGYGKSIMKPVETESRIFDDENKFKVFLSRHYNWISSFVRFGKKIKVNLIKTLNEHFNICQVGTMILSMSKRIMNEVMCLAEDNGLEVYYQDTDSNHILDKDIEVLAKNFKSKYNRDLIGEELGQFHSDFEIEGASDVYSRRAIFLGKKCYIDELVGKDKSGNEIVDYHIRMKGVPNSCILYTSKKLGYATPFDMYKDLYAGKAIEFDLTQDGNKANFKFGKNYEVKTCDIFKRKLAF